MVAAGIMVAALGCRTPRRRLRGELRQPGRGNPPWGVDRARDLSVRPGDDFYRYADGHWLDSNQIPADRPLGLFR